MKKILIVMLMAAILLCGCHADSERENASEYFGELSKVQEIMVIPANTSAATQILTQGGELSAFISALDLEQWKLETLPAEANLMGTFQLSQEETIHFGESAADGILHPVCEILCYEKIPYLTLKVAGMEMTFEVPDATVESLTGYFDQSACPDTSD